ncbi:hypothetical protein NA63_0434 [Flavobacteriaceae bacterium MAR_2010_105]|nr:hypothetical protein NA63_0434 [Flavobacteriaceae bacterium MAR_2010_105]
MKEKHIYILLTIALLITIYGLVTGQFFFLLILFPFGFGWFKRKKSDEKD